MQKIVLAMIFLLATCSSCGTNDVDLKNDPRSAFSRGYMYGCITSHTPNDSIDYCDNLRKQIDEQLSEDLFSSDIVTSFYDGYEFGCITSRNPNEDSNYCKNLRKQAEENKYYEQSLQTTGMKFCPPKNKHCQRQKHYFTFN